MFQAYFLCLSLFSPFITKLLKGAIFSLKNIFSKLLLPPQKSAALGGRLVRLVVKPALAFPLPFSILCSRNHLLIDSEDFPSIVPCESNILIISLHVLILCQCNSTLHYLSTILLRFWLRRVQFPIYHQPLQANCYNYTCRNNTF